MKKIPTLWARDYKGGGKLLPDELLPECSWVLAGEGLATIKRDGTATLVQDGRLYKRYDAKNGKTPPDGFIPAQEPDPVTGHHPGWLLVADGPEDKWFREARDLALPTEDGTYELCGPKWSANPECVAVPTFFRHGMEPFPGVVLSRFPGSTTGAEVYAAVGRALAAVEHEGVVWHHPDGRMAKAKRRDFGLDWPVKP